MLKANCEIIEDLSNFFLKDVFKQLVMVLLVSA